jgi:hypothetical protein
MRKYGTDNFSIAALYEASSFFELQVVERGLIAEHGTHASSGKGYNLTSGGEGRDRVDQLFGEDVLGAVLTEEIVAFARDPRHWNVSNADVLAMIAQKFELSCSIDTLKDARNGSSWTHLNKQYLPIKRGRGVRDDVVSEEMQAVHKANLAKYHDAAVIAAAKAKTGKRGKNARLLEATVRDIFFNQESLVKTATKFGISKKMVLLIKQRKAHKYLTQGL